LQPFFQTNDDEDDDDEEEEDTCVYVKQTNEITEKFDFFSRLHHPPAPPPFYHL